MLEFNNPQLICRESTNQDLQYVINHEIQQSDFVSSWSEEKHQKAIKNSNIAHLIIEFSGSPIGYLILKGIEDHHNLELTRIVVSDPGKGYGKAIIEAVKDYAFQKRTYNRLWLDVIHYNSRALTLYLKQGFILEGTLREVDFYKEKYNSLHILSILRREYQGVSP